jgi:N-methylhydantoinase B
LTSQKTVIPPQGLFGGLPGATNRWFLRREGLESQVLEHSIGTAELGYGDIVSCQMAGGWGYGDPLKRDPETVRKDVLLGYVSLENARDEYGVVLDADTLKVQKELTEELRKHIILKPRLGTDNIPEVHRGALYES